MLLCVFTGFASGLPLYLLIQLVPGWLRFEGVSLKEIGFFTLVTLPYTWKFLWSPLVERYYVPALGRRRSWLLLTQVLLVFFIALLGQWDTHSQLLIIAVAAFLVALFSATQDIVLDAYRRELLQSEGELALGNTVHVQVYRLAGLVPGSLGFILSEQMAWPQVFWVMAGFMAASILVTIRLSEAIERPTVPVSLYDATVTPFREFFSRAGVKHACVILGFVFFYKLGDSMATALSTPFFIDMGFTAAQIGLIAKNAGLWSAIVGGILGGLIVVKTGINRALWYFGVVQMITILGFVWLSNVGNNPWVLAIAISAEYLGVGLGAAAFVAFMARETNPAMAATQFALLTALAALPRSFAAAATGILVEQVGWTSFFYLCFLLAIPGMVLLFWVAPLRRRSNLNDASSEFGMKSKQLESDTHMAKIKTEK